MNRDEVEDCEDEIEKWISERHQKNLPAEISIDELWNDILHYSPKELTYKARRQVAKILREKFYCYKSRGKYVVGSGY